MTNLTPISSFDPVVQLETSTPALGGPGGPMNQQAQALLNRDAYIDGYQAFYSALKGISANEWAAISNGTSVLDCSPLLNAALAANLAVILPPGTYSVGSTLTVTRNGAAFLGVGQNAVTLKALAGFTGTRVVEFGFSASAVVVETVAGSGFTVDCNGVSGLEGVGFFGCRDGSSLKNIRVKNCLGTHFRFGLAGDGTGSAVGLMSEGVALESLDAVSTANDIAGVIFVMDGLFETSVTNCKALGQSTRNNVATGFKIGGNAESRGLKLEGCAVGNLKNAGSTGSVGIHYADWASECWDNKTTFESIHGQAVLMSGGLTSGSIKPVLCRSEVQRLYAPGAVDAGVLNPANIIGAASSCYIGPIKGFSSTKTWIRFQTVVAAGQGNNRVEIDCSVDPATVLGGIVVFDASVTQSNVVTGFASSTTARREARFTPAGTSFVTGANLVQLQYNAADTTWQGVPGVAKFQWKAPDATTLFTVDGTLKTVTANAPFNVGGAWNSANPFIMGTFYLWFDATGALRKKVGAPTSDTDGTLV